MKRLLLICILMLFVGLLISSAQTNADAKIFEKHTITVDADNLIGEMYNLWDVRVINVPEKWGEKGFAEMMKNTTKHAKYIVNVRSLGGTHNQKCEWFKGVDDNGDPICDFKPFIDILKAQFSVGFTPWIVLDNVPWEMAAGREKHQYGQCYPPDDFDVWYKYVRKFIQALVSEFGLKQVSKWHFRVGTEPDLFPHHWAGAKEEYFKHYDYTVAAVESVIKDPLIGPGNMLMWNGAQTGQKGGRWGFDILKHCAEGKNYYTGKNGTRITFFSQSVYSWTPKPFLYEDNLKKMKAELAKYPSIRNIDCEIHEYGELMECVSSGDALSNTEWYVGFYLHTIDLAYKYNVRRIFNWDHHLGMVTSWQQNAVGLFQPWVKVMDCLEVMENGKRVKVLTDGEKELKFGTIGVWKGDSFYALVYSHHDDINKKIENNINLTLVGKNIEKYSSWSIDEKLLNKDNGVYIHELYKDIEAAGIPPIKTKFYIQRDLERRYGKDNQQAASEVARKNLQKYQKLGEMKQDRSGERIETKNGKLELNLHLNGSGFRFIKLTPMASTKKIVK